MKNQIAIIDYGTGNLHSVASALKHVAPDTDVIVSADTQSIRAADQVILPGVGAIRDCVAEIRRLGFDQLITQEIASGKPVLAICVGLQALLQSSEENDGVECLGYFEGEVRGFAEHEPFQAANVDHSLKVPHMGWNQVKQLIAHPLWAGIPDESRFYFVHSFFVAATKQSQIAGLCQFGIEFNAALFDNNLFACQFHPEKSSNSGLQLLRNFSQWNGHL